MRDWGLVPEGLHWKIPAMSQNGEKMGSGGFKTSAGPKFGRLQQVFDDVWWAWGTTRFAPGVLFPRNMFVIRDGGSLTVVHPVMLPEEDQQKLEELGTVDNIVKLGAFHGMDDPKYVDRYQPTVWAPDGVDQPAGVTTDRVLRPGGETPIAGMSVFDFASSRAPELALLLPRHDGVLFTCDSVQSWETTAGTSFLGGVMARFMGFRGRACIGPGWRKLCEPKEGEGFGPEFRALLAEFEFRHLCSGHGVPLKETAKIDLRSAVESNYPSSQETARAAG